MIPKLVLHIFAAANVALLAICAYSLDSETAGAWPHIAAPGQLFDSIHSGIASPDSSIP
jgi:hypothetical protein